jgi:hypothetical protein
MYGKRICRGRRLSNKKSGPFAAPAGLSREKSYAVPAKSRLAEFIADDSRCNRRQVNGETQADIARSYAVDPTTIGRLAMARHPD